MTSNFKNNVGSVLKGKDNYDIWFTGLRTAAKFEGLWTGHLDKEPVPITVPTQGDAARIASLREAKAAWEAEDEKIRAGILLVTDYHLHNLIDEDVHITAWSVLQVLKKNFDTKSDLEFVHLVLKMNQLKMMKGKSSATINSLRPIKQIIDRDYKNQCITWAFLIQSCLHVPDYKNLLTSLSASGTLKTLNFEQLAEKFIELDKTFDTEFAATSVEPEGIAFQVNEDSNFTRGQRGRGRGRSFGQTSSRGRGRGQRSQFGQQQQQPSQKQSTSFQGQSRENQGYRNPNQMQKPGTSTVVCNRCRRTGHVSTKCRVPANKIPHLRQGTAHNVDDDYDFQTFDSCLASAEVKWFGNPSFTPVDNNVVQGHTGFAVSSLQELKGVANNVYTSDEVWILDTGATQHMTGNRKFFTDLRMDVHGEVHMADRSSQPVKGVGTVILKLKDLPDFTLTDVLYVPALKRSLLSLSTLVHRGYNMNITAEDKTLKVFYPPSNEVVLTGLLDGRLLTLCGNTSGEIHLTDTEVVLHTTLTPAKLSSDALWHARMGHIRLERLRQMQNSVVGLPKFSSKPLLCEACIIAKSSRKPFPTRQWRSTEKLQLVHSDICGPMPVCTLNRKLYYITFIDDFSKKIWIGFLEKKDEAFKFFLAFKARAERESGCRIQAFRSDNGGEYTSKEFKKYLTDQGIKHQRTIPGTPQQNGVAERLNRTVMNMARALLIYKNVPAYLWGEAISTSMHILNTMSPTPQGVSPHEKWYGHPPSVSHFRIFGSTCYAHVLPEHRNKLQARAVKGIFIGYPLDQKRYKVFLPDQRKIIVTRDAIFAETEERLLTLDRRSDRMKPHDTDARIYDIQIPTFGGEDRAKLLKILESDTEFPHHHCDDGQQMSSSSVPSHSRADKGKSIVVETEDPVVPEAPASPASSAPSVTYDPFRDRMIEDTYEAPSQPIAGRGIREARQLERDIKPDEVGKTGTRSAYRARMQQSSYIELEPEELHLALNNEPLSYQEAARSAAWRNAMQEEYQSLIKNGTWELVELPLGRKVVRNKWVFRNKYKADGTLDKHKARLVAKGFSQEIGIDYTEVFAPTAKWPTIRTIVALAAQQGWKIHQLDVKTAFLNGDLNEEIYMAQPEGFEVDGKEHLVCRLRKSLYGLKQAPRAWYTKLSDRMKELNFDMCDYQDIDATLFIKRTKDGIIYLVVFVDDMIVTGNSERLIQNLKKDLMKTFEISDLGLMRYYLGVEVTQENGRIFLNQQKYIEDLAEKFQLDGGRPITTPMEVNLKLSESDNTPDADATLYRRLVGSLIYVTNTRPDVAYSTAILARFMTKPSETHWLVALRVLKYLKTTSNYGLMYEKNKDFRLIAYTDSDFAGDKDTGRSTTGFVTFLGSAPISWRTKRQKIVADSTAEAEYVAAAETSKEVTWMRKLLHEIGYTQKSPTKLHVDNQSAISMAKNPVFHDRTKHISTKVHKIRELVQNGTIQLQYCCSAEQIADIFTKPLNKTKFEQFRQLLGLRPSISS